MKRALLLVTLLVACGDESTIEIVDDPVRQPPSYPSPPKSPSPAPSSSGQPRPPSPPESCAVDSRFTSVRRVPGLEQQSASHPSLDPDERQIAFEVDVDGEPKIQLAVRADRTSPFGPGAPLTIYDVPGFADVDLHYQGLVFASSRNGSGFDLFRRAPDMIEALPVASSPSADDRQPFVVQSRIYFSSDRRGDFGIFEASFGSIATRIAELDTPGAEGHPVLTADGLVIFFSSDRPGGRGGKDVWVAVRPTLSSPFGTATNVSDVNADGDDAPSFLSVDRCRLYFTRTIGGLPYLYVAERPRN